MKPTSGFARRSLLALASLLVALAGVEGALRALGAGPVQVNPDQRSFWDYDTELGWRSRPGREGVFDNGFFRTRVSINAKGLRGPERDYRKPPGTRRVVVIGDSFAWGFGVEADEIFAARLEAAIPDVQVINGGVSGYSTDQALLWLRDEGVRYEPDLVVYALSGNDDIMNHMQVAYWVYYKPSFYLDASGGLQLQGVPVPHTDGWGRLRHGLRSRSAIARAAEVAWQGHEASFVQLARALPDAAAPHALTAALVDEMERVSRSAGADFVVVTNAQFWFSPGSTPDRLVETFRSRGRSVIDVEASPGWNPEAMQIPADGHWNADGHTFVSRLIESWARERSLLGMAPEAATD